MPFLFACFYIIGTQFANLKVVFFRRSSIGTFIRPHSSEGTHPISRISKEKEKLNQPKLDYRSMVSIDDMPELFVSFDSKFFFLFYFFFVWLTARLIWYLFGNCEYFLSRFNLAPLRILLPKNNKLLNCNRGRELKCMPEANTYSY